MNSTIKNYISITKPGIIRANVMTAIAGYLLASKSNINLSRMGWVIVSVTLIIASGCVINNITDRNIDSKMNRTKRRPLITGDISLSFALVYATIIGLLGFGMLIIKLNTLVVLIGLIGFTVYVGVYALAKRTTSFSTIIGSASGSMALVAGYCAVSGTFDAAAWLLLIIMTIWQMPHFYAISIYASKDYKAAGIPIHSLAHGADATKRSIIGYIGAFIISTVLLYAFGYTSLIYLVLVTSVGLYWLYKGIGGYKTVDDNKWAHQMFGYSLLSLLVFCLLISTNSIFK